MPPATNNGQDPSFLGQASLPVKPISSPISDTSGIESDVNGLSSNIANFPTNYPAPPTIGTYNAGEQGQIDTAGNGVGAQYDALIAQAQRKNDQSMAVDTVSAGQRGGFMNSQFAGQAAVSPIGAGNFIGAGGQLRVQQQNADFNVQQLQMQKISAIQTAQSEMQKYIDTGKQENFQNAQTAYQDAVTAHEDQQKAILDAQTANLNAQQASFDLNVPLAQAGSAVQKYVLDQLTKYPDVVNSYVAGGGSLADFNKMTASQLSDLIAQSPAYLKAQQTANLGPGIIGEYQYAVSQGYKGSFSQYQDEDANRKISAASGINSTDAQNLLATLDDYNGQKYITPTDLTGYTAGEKSNIISAAKAAGIPTLSAKDADVLNTIQSAQSNLQDFNTFITTSGNGGSPILPKNFFGQPEQQANVILNKYLTINNQLAAFNTWKLSVIPLLSALKGSGSGGGGSSRLFGTISDLIPSDTDTVGEAQTKIANINTLLANGAASIIKTTSDGGGKVTIGGTQYDVGQTVTNSKGQKGTVNADGSITLQ